MGFLEAIQSGFQNYVTFSGRASRSEYWYWTLFSILANVAASFIGGENFSSVVSLALLLPGLAVAARRLHDTDKSAWLLLLILIPILGWAVLLYFYVIIGTNGPNQYGPDPLGGPGGDWDANMPPQGFHRSNIPTVPRKD